MVIYQLQDRGFNGHGPERWFFTGALLLGWFGLRWGRDDPSDPNDTGRYSAHTDGFVVTRHLTGQRRLGE